MNNSAFLISDETSYRWRKYSTTLKDFLETSGKLPDVVDERNLKVVYATPKAAFAKYIIPMINGKTTLPIISFTLSEETNVRETPSLFPVFEFRGEKERESFKFRHPLTKQLVYKCDLYTLTIRESNIILTQLEHLANEFKPYYTKVDGQGTEYFLSSITPETILNPDAGKVKVIHHSFTITVPQAKLFLVEKEDNNGVVKEIRTKLSYGVKND